MSNQTLQQNIRYYNEEASIYDESRYETESGRRLDQFQKRVLLQYLNDVPTEAKILEYGCGTGRFLPTVREKGHRLVGVDVSSNMLLLAEKRLHMKMITDIDLKLIDGKTIPFADNSFDAIYSILVVNLVPDFNKLFIEISRVLKPGGTFIFNVPNFSSVFFPVGLYVGVRGRTRTSNAAGSRYSHWFSAGEVKSALDSAGFYVDQVVGQPLTVCQRDNVPAAKAPIGKWLLSKSMYYKARLSN